MRSDCSGTLHPKAIEGLKLFNQKQFFEAHEELEEAWRDETGTIRELYRGMLQAAVVYLHITRGNYDGAVKVYGRCLKWLNLWPDVCRGVRVGKLKQDLGAAVKAIQVLGKDQIGRFDTSLFEEIDWSEKRIWICDRCGAEMSEKNCKVSCPNCGNRFDCSDLNIYFN